MHEAFLSLAIGESLGKAELPLTSVKCSMSSGLRTYVSDAPKRIPANSGLFGRELYGLLVKEHEGGIKTRLVEGLSFLTLHVIQSVRNQGSESQTYIRRLMHIFAL